MGNIRIRWKAILPALVVLAGAIGSPQMTAALPDRWSHALLIIGGIAQIFTPAVATNRPPSTPPSDSSGL
jgi:hypothetical protein